MTINTCPTRGREVQKTKDCILDAAETLFASRGYRQTSLRYLAQVAGVNQAAVNYHFGSKEGLLRSLIRRQIEILQMNFLENLKSLETETFEVKVEGVLKAFANSVLMMSELNGKASVPICICLASDPDPEIQKICHEYSHTFYEQVICRLRATASRLSEDSIRWRFTFFLGALCRTMLLLSTGVSSAQAGKAVDKDSVFAELQHVLAPTFFV